MIHIFVLLMNRSMKKILYIFLMLSLLASCADYPVYREISSDEQKRVDSIVRSQQGIDSLTAVAERFMAEGCLVGEVAVYRELGRALRNATRYQEAIDAHSKGLEIAKDIRDTLQVIQALNNIGTVYRRMGMLEEAASWHYQGLTWCERWSDTSAVALKNRVVSLNGLGNVHLSMGKDSLALTSFREALKGETRLGSATGMAINYANIGAIWESYGQTDSARVYYGLSLECNVKAGSDLGISLCHTHFGRLAEAEEDLHTAFKEYKSAYEVLSKGPDKWHWLESCISLSRVSMRMEDMSAARRYLSSALQVAEGLNSAAHLADICYQYYQMDNMEGRYHSALQWLEKYTEYVSSLYAQRNEDAIFELRSEYERERNSNEIKHIKEAHSQKLRRDRIILISTSIALVFAALAIVFLVYYLRQRSRNNRILKAMDNTKNNYFTDIAHEFRTPLTIILSAAHSIRDNIDDEGMKRDADDISRHSRGLLNLVNQILDIAKMTSGLAPDPVWRSGDVISFVSGICERNRRYALTGGIELEFIHDEASLYMDFIPDLMLRIVQNLISNALKFTGEGKKVCVSMEHIRGECNDADLVRISVKDEGMGMSQEQVADIFKPFYQADVPQKDMGTGLGLKLVKLAAETMGGSVKAESILGKGSEFIVTLPVCHGIAVDGIPDRTENEYDCVLRSDDLSISDYNGVGSDLPRILIVEDRPEVAKWEMRQLGSDYAFYFASDGEKGLEKALEIIPDMIVTDVMMPDMDGFEMCRRVRESELLCHIPVVMVTARATLEDRLKGLEAGADAYLEKPYDEHELDLRVRKLLQQRTVLKKVFSEQMDRQEGTSPASYSERDQAFVDKLDAALEDAFASGKVDCEELAAIMCVGRAQLNRKIKAITGCRTTEYILMARLSKARKLLRTTDLSVGEISMRCGIEDVGYFSTLFRKHTGVTPTAYRNS